MAGSLFGSILDFAERTPVLGRTTIKFEQRLWDRHIKRLRVKAGERAYAATDGVIAKGLFKGMRVDPQTSWGFDQYAVLSGQYERELQPIVTRAVASHYPCFIDIGCANGLYAVGLALVANGTPVIAYDIDPKARAATRTNAELNGVAGDIDIRDEATHADLGAVIRRYGTAFAICDIEGGELSVLDPIACPALLDTDMLVEVHGDVQSVIATLSDRFRASHDAHVVPRTARSPFEDSYVEARSEDEAWALVSEGRTFTRDNWLLLSRKSAAYYKDLVTALGI